ncbi:hypothetical protein BOTBODRAFT_101205 [Botryobasidium botryosum FD-172 SS1]|uniref:Peptide hydrolase n=1 Tax=Botryobasidium botryosum (strain FD-172 SS1) TaxID=930990 RepID=A0A067MZD9_BOTB1|nr:hypothetical protein BOTBODRAFT_101205 [Botryobasidium botryosum FD-172 SS1]
MLRATYPRILEGVSDRAIDVLRAREQRRLFGPGFSDITDFGSDIEPVAALDSSSSDLVVPKPSEHPELEKLFEMVSAKELKSTVTTLTGTFRTRFYRSKHAREASVWVHNEMRAVIGTNGTVSYFENSGFDQPNVVGRIPASGGDDDDDAEVLIIGGHLDSTCGFWCGAEGPAPGADDDASGLSAVLSVLRILAASGWRGKYAIEGHAYAGEEGGLLGSQNIARKYAASGKKVRGMLNLEMLGTRNRTSTISVMTDPNPKMSAHMSAIVKAYVPTAEMRNVECGYGCSDHVSWADSGYPVVCLAAWGPGDYNLNPNYHSRGDTADQLDYESIADFVKATLAWIVEMSA